MIWLWGTFIDFLDIIGARLQSGRDGPICSRSKGRAAHQIGSASIRVDVKLPATEIQTGIGRLYDFDIPGYQYVAECHRCGRTAGQRDFLRIGGFTLVFGIDCRIAVPNLFDVVCACREIRDGNGTAAVGGVWPGNQGRAGRVRVDTELPAREIESVLSGLGNIEATGLQGVGEADAGCLPCCQCNLLGIRAAAAVLTVDAGGLVSDFLHIHSSRRKAADTDFASAVRSMRTGNPCGAC